MRQLREAVDQAFRDAVAQVLAVGIATGIHERQDCHRIDCLPASSVRSIEPASSPQQDQKANGRNGKYGFSSPPRRSYGAPSRVILRADLPARRISLRLGNTGEILPFAQDDTAR